ncbi:hypothetical protein AFCA_012978 [Aspergillus flavus]|uniref:Uncharacterized protein n=1 Tax=Aspergillus flavus TaxID=5059 RepID=A0AB74CBT9_ASPFL|nr:uncharacterized protein G4B84_012046 [Aspergillus flavus NRRL3357]QMW48572.1 hypothetical protein G4B11_012090 [Aspergillus flavus]KAF7626434.1 hypothetical protein AFLA_013826 [Aspergillus flavus NRRL3357]QMW36517.1 hypothetical protein G4B84_012046 [Aspergillus flavus NRRL3357]RMZ44083.1 hypothetical protein CA14_004220 [Aspergillus flavus]UDD65807.1 hypothetical protein AFCA_012978 [Aspergillus flavus]
MSAVGKVLIRRGHELISARLEYRQQPQNPIHGWLGFSIVVLTALAFGFAIFWVDYTCNHVIATLAAVEDSNPTTYVRLDCEDSNDPCNPNDPEVAAPSTTKPITSGLRSAIKHLRARGGFWSCFRGFRMYLAYTGFDLGAGYLLPAVVPIPTHSLLSLFLGKFIASMLLATWQMAIAPAAALYNVLMFATLSLPIAAARLSGGTVDGIVANPKKKELLNFLAMGILPAILFILVSIPARGVFTRVAASMLPEEDDPIVPFDRRFGGKVKSAMVGGSGELSLLDAWTSFDWAARIRYVKIILKALVIEVALGVVGGLLVMGELELVTPSRHT